MMNADKATVFPETRWTLVLRLDGLSEACRRQAFEELCLAYWSPLYVYARRCGHSPHDAEDFTQGFFEQILRRKRLVPLDPGKGRLRTFLKAAFRNFIADEVRRKTRQKRGGGTEVFSLDVASAERRYQRTLRDEVTPDDAFDRQWADAILRRALAALRTNFRTRGRAQTFRELRGFLVSDESSPTYAEVASRLGQTENTIAAAVRRMRHEFRAILLREIADTLAQGEQVEEELRYLLRIAS